MIESKRRIADGYHPVNPAARGLCQIHATQGDNLAFKSIAIRCERKVNSIHLMPGFDERLSETYLKSGTVTLFKEDVSDDDEHMHGQALTSLSALCGTS